MDINEHSESEDANGEGDGVWSPDIEQCFREALLLYPPCGRRKHILQEEGGGKMYGRNELIARYIMLRTGKSRTRKQVSSHIQVLARRKAKAEATSSSSNGVSPAPSAISRTQVQSTGSMELDQSNQPTNTPNEITAASMSSYYDVWVDRPIVSQKIRLVEFSAFIEYRTFPTINIANVTTQNQLIHSVHSPCSNEVLMSPTIQTTTIKAEGVDAPAIGHLQIQPLSGQPTPTSTHPLAFNHHLSAQYNQASYGHMNNHTQPHLTNKTHLTASGHPATHCNNLFNNHAQQQQSCGFKRHSYVQIDYRQSLGRQTNKLERIDISQIQDKFPEIGGSDGLFQRGPSDAFFLVKFWADLNNDYEYNIDDQNSYFGFSSHFETIDSYKNITCSTKACSYGLQVVEKMEKMYGAFNSSNGRYSYGINRSPMCDFMQKFIKKLRQLPRASQMNSVLENFTVLQVITSETTSEILLCLAYVFEVSSPDQQNNGAQYHVYKLTKD